MDTMSGSIRGSEPTSPTSPTSPIYPTSPQGLASPDARGPRGPHGLAHPQALHQALNSLHYNRREYNPAQITKKEWS